MNRVVEMALGRELRLWMGVGLVVVELGRELLDITNAGDVADVDADGNADGNADADADGDMRDMRDGRDGGCGGGCGGFNDDSAGGACGEDMARSVSSPNNSSWKKSSLGSPTGAGYC